MRVGNGVGSPTIYVGTLVGFGVGEGVGDFVGIGVGDPGE